MTSGIVSGVRRGGSMAKLETFLKYRMSVPSSSRTRRIWTCRYRAKARAAAEHLLPQDARLDRAQKHDEFQRRDVHAGREHVHGDDDLGIRAIAELADALERPVYVRVASDLLHEGVTLSENIAADAHKLVGVRRVGNVIDGEDEDFRKATGRGFMFVSVFGDFLDDLAVAVGCGDGTFDVGGFECALVFELVECLLAGV